MPLLDLLRSAHEPRTAAELWFEIETMRKYSKCEDLSRDKSDLERSLRVLAMQGFVKETCVDGLNYWCPVYRDGAKAFRLGTKAELQKVLFG